jgi:hypothetical protein
MYVQFPSYQHTEGLVSVATLAPGGTTLDLAAEGKVTSHLVKYSHHPDGRAHFAQDGRVLTRIKKKSIPLNDMNDHCFTTQVQGLRAFEALDFAEYDTAPTTKRTMLNFDFARQVPEAVKIVGRVYQSDGLRRLCQAPVPPAGATPTFGSTIPTIDPQGAPRPAFRLSVPVGCPGDSRILMLTCEAIPLMDEDGQPALTFIGGFDAQRIVSDHAVETSLLALLYPPSDSERCATG